MMTPVFSHPAKTLIAQQTQGIYGLRMLDKGPDSYIIQYLEGGKRKEITTLTPGYSVWALLPYSVQIIAVFHIRNKFQWPPYEITYPVSALPTNSSLPMACSLTAPLPQS
jgi:hypothetical protein